MYSSVHYNRLMSSLENYYGENLSELKKKYFGESLEKGLEKLDKSLSERYLKSPIEYYIRVTILPVGEGLSLSEGIDFYFLLNAYPLRGKPENITKVIFKERQSKVMPFGKTGYYLEQVKSVNILKSDLEEVIYIDNNEWLIEASTSNILLLDWAEKSILVPESLRFAFKGFMMDKVLSIFKKNGYQIKVDNLDKNSLDRRVILFTNAVNIFRYDLSRVQNDKKGIIAELNKVKKEILINSFEGE